MLWEIDDPGIGTHKNMANPMKMSLTPPVLRNGAPLLGQDTDHILEEAGYRRSRSLTCTRWAPSDEDAR